MLSAAHRCSMTEPAFVVRQCGLRMECGRRPVPRFQGERRRNSSRPCARYVPWTRGSVGAVLVEQAIRAPRRPRVPAYFLPLCAWAGFARPLPTVKRAATVSPFRELVGSLEPSSCLLLHLFVREPGRRLTGKCSSAEYGFCAPLFVLSRGVVPFSVAVERSAFYVCCALSRLSLLPGNCCCVCRNRRLRMLCCFRRTGFPSSYQCLPTSALWVSLDGRQSSGIYQVAPLSVLLL